MFRTAIARQARLFSTTPAARKGPVDAAKDVLKKVDRTVADGAVKGIEVGGMWWSFFFVLSHSTVCVHWVLIPMGIGREREIRFRIGTERIPVDDIGLWNYEKAKPDSSNSEEYGFLIWLYSLHPSSQSPPSTPLPS